MDHQLSKKFECLAILMGAAFALTACGGGSSQSTATGASSTTAATAATADVHEIERAATAVAHAAPTPIADATGTVLTYSTAGFIDNTNLFFTAFGNGRACSSCHVEGQAWSVTPAALQARFNATGGSDPIFQLVDGANSPLASVATLAQKRAAYSMLLNKGVIRIGLPIPSGAEFELTQVDDPYAFASAAELSLFRRPLPSTNLQSASEVMWDGRETFNSASSSLCLANTTPAQCFATTNFDLLNQANSAVEGHAQFAAGLTAAQQQAIVGFESALSTAQASDNAAGGLNIAGAIGGPLNLSSQLFYFGINDFFTGDYRTKAAFNPAAMNLFGAWSDAATSARASIARGEQVFDTLTFNITGVGGLNDVLNRPTIRGTCSTCHDAPNDGTLSTPRLLNTGVAAPVLRTSDMPLYTLKNIATGATLQTTDPGRALITGKWGDVGKFKVPNLRGLAARAPYFHNGVEASLLDIVKFYNVRFQIGFTPQQVDDLTNFLQAL